MRKQPIIFFSFCILLHFEYGFTNVMKNYNSEFYAKLAFSSKSCYLKFTDSNNSVIILNKDQLDLMIKETEFELSQKRRDSIIYNLLLRDSLPDRYLINRTEGVHYHRVFVEKDSLSLALTDSNIIQTCFNSENFIKPEYIKEYEWYLIAKLFSMGYFLYNEDESGYLYFFKQ